MALESLKSKLSQLPGAKPTTMPAASFTPVDTSLLSVVSPATDGSTPATVDASRGTINTIKLLNPMNATAPIRPLFGKAGEEKPLLYGGPIIGGATEIASRTIEALPSAALTFLANTKLAANKFDPNTGGVKVPFDVSRLGLATHPGKQVVQNSFDKMDQKFRMLESTHPGRTNINIALASLSPVMDALDAVAAGEMLSSVARAGLKVTAYSPELERALQEYGLKGMSADDFNTEFVKRFNSKARKLIIDGDQAGLDELGRSTNTIVTHMTGKGIPTLNKFGQIVQDLSRTGLQDSKYGFVLHNPIVPELAPEAVRTPLPGYADEPGQAPAFGLSTRRVTRVGGENKTGDLFSSDGSGNFSKVLPKDSMPAVIKDGLDTFVVKNPEGYAVIEGTTGLQLGVTGRTMAEAVSSAKQEISSNPNLDEHMNSKPLSPRYVEDTTPQPGSGRKLAPYNASTPAAPVAKPATLPGINPDQTEVLTPEQVAPLAQKATDSYWNTKIGRGISDKTFARGHAGFPKVLRQLLEDGIVKPDEVRLFDNRYTYNLHEAMMKVATGDFVKDPLAKLQKLKYNEETIAKKYAKENYKTTNRRGLQEQGVRGNANQTPRVDRADTRPRLAGGDRPSVGGSAGGDQGQGGKAVSRKNGATLPKELSGAKPRYGYQNKQFELKFANDVDKALYIVAQKTPSKRDADYISFLNNVFSDLSDEQIRSAGFDIRTQIKNLAKNAEPGIIEVPSSQKISGTSSKESSGGKEVARGTKDIDQLIRMLDREKQSLAQAEAHPEAHAKAYGAGKADEYRKKIKQLVRRIEEDHTPRTSKKTSSKTPKVYPLEERISELATENGFLEDVVAGNRARALSRYANKNGELPEALGGQKGMFANEGDSIVTQLGYPDSETARAAYSDYLLQKKRLFVVRNNLRVLKDTLREMKITDTDERSLVKMLNKNASLSEKQISDLAKKGKAPLTEKQIEERKQLAEERQKRLIGQMGATEPAIGWQAPEQTLSALLQAQPLTLGEFEKMNESLSLKQMVVDTSTPVKRKINLIDNYLRTPDRVLEKIGLKPIADNLRHSYESYVAELPGHIDVISSWAKRVPEPGANERIFDYLDGQLDRNKFKAGGADSLHGDELKVAKEIKQYLHDWAERLGLPDDNRISHYITHVFAIGEVAKEFDEDVAKLIKDKQPGSVYDPFLEKRLGKKGYIRDTWASLDAYAKRAVRKANMDPVLDQMKTAAARLEESQATYLKKYANLINMRPTDIDNLTDNLLKSIFGYRFGQRPTALLTRTARQWIYRSMLGLNFSSAIKNLTQGLNTFTVLKTKYTLRGYRELMMHPNSQELEDAGILKQDFIQDRTLSSTRKAIQKIDKGLFTLFDLAEKINRGSAYFGAKAKAMDLGASEYDAMQYAKKIVRDTQFQFGSIDTPVGLNSDMAKVLTQFMSFGFKQAEFAAENIMAKNYGAIVRYILGALFMTYVVGKVFNIKGRDFIPGYSFTKFGTPPTLALPLAIFKAVVDAPDAYGHPRSLSQKGQDVFSNIPFPASIQARNTYKLFSGAKKTSSASGGSFGTGKKLTPMKGASAASGRKLKPFGR